MSGYEQSIHELVDENMCGDDIYSLSTKATDEEQKIGLLKLAAEKGHGVANWDLFNIDDKKLEPGDDGSEALAYLTKAADNGYWYAQYRLGCIYQEGTLPYCKYPIYKKSIKYYELARSTSFKAMQEDKQSATAGLIYIFSSTRLSEMFLNGVGTVIREDKAFNLLKGIAYNGYYCLKLSIFYFNGIGVEVNIDEAYIWAIINNSYSTLAKENVQQLIEQIKCTLKIKHRIALQVEADRRVRIMKQRPLTDKDVEEFYKTFEYGKAKELVSNSAVKVDVANDTPAVEEDVELSDNNEYKYLSKVKKDFDVSKIKLGIVVSRPLGKEDTVDFSELSIFYNNHNKDRKAISLFSGGKYRFSKAARLLLIKLALQFEEKDTIKRNKKIAKILQDPNLSNDVTSALNRLANTLFPNCLPRQNGIICKQDGVLKISLTIDKWTIENAMDFKEVSSLI